MKENQTQEEKNDGRVEGCNGWATNQNSDGGHSTEGPNNEDSNASADTAPSGDEQYTEEIESQPDTVKNDQLLCDTEINQNHEEISKQQLEIDKQLLTLSSGLIVLSLTFAKDVAPKQPSLVWLLVVGLVVIAACIGCVLFSFRWSIAGLEKAQQYWRARREDTYGKHSFPTKHNAAIKYVNILSCWLFGIGFACITLFVTLNVTKEMNMGTDKTQYGSPIKAPITIAPKRSDTAGTTIKTPVPPPPPAK